MKRVALGVITSLACISMVIAKPNNAQNQKTNSVTCDTREKKPASNSDLSTTNDSPSSVMVYQITPGEKMRAKLYKLSETGDRKLKQVINIKENQSELEIKGNLDGWHWLVLEEYDSATETWKITSEVSIGSRSGSR